MSFFNNANNPVIEGGQFTNILRGDAHFHSHYGTETNNSQKGLPTLYRNIAAGALYDAAERSDPPKCHPHTRMAIRDEMMSWIRDPEIRKKFIIWLYGPAGAGKSAIAQTIAEICAKEEILVASFFFSRTGIGRNNTSRFISTLAYQLYTAIPEIRGHILQVVEEKPSVFSSKLLTQMKLLIINPLNQAVASGLMQDGHSRPRLVIVDGLDEAREESSHTELLEALTTCIEESKVTLVFIVASRPEYAIRRSFNKHPLQSLMRGLPLDEQYKPDVDIRIFLQSEFDEIRQSHPSGASLPLSWPDDEKLDYLVEKSSGQFIYASTVMKYINSPRHNPMRCLQIICGLSGPGKDTPFSQLDALYDMILSSVDQASISRVLDILALLFLNHGYESYLSIDFIEQLLGCDPGDVLASLTDMHALIHVPSSAEDSNRLRLYHASLHDFLMDKSRTTTFFIDARVRHSDLALRLLQHITAAPISDYISDDEDRFVSLLNGFIGHLSEASVVDDIVSALDRSLSVGQLLSNLSLRAIYATKWDDLFDCLRDTNYQTLFRRFLGEFDGWFLHRFQQYPPIVQDCLSATFAIPRYIISDIPDIFEILAHAFPFAEACRLKQLDRDHFGFQEISSANIAADHQDKNLFHRFFTNSSRAGIHFADGHKFITLAKQIVEMLYCRAGPDLPIVMDSLRPLDLESSDAAWYERLQFDHGDLSYFSKVLTEASIDVGLARTLWDHVILSKSDDAITRGRQNMAIASFAYIERCGVALPSEDHALRHLPGCTVCARDTPLMHERFTQLEISQGPAKGAVKSAFQDDSIKPSTKDDDSHWDHISVHVQSAPPTSSSSNTLLHDRTDPLSSLSTSTFPSASRQSLISEATSASLPLKSTPAVRTQIPPSSTVNALDTLPTLPRNRMGRTPYDQATHLSAVDYGLSISSTARTSVASLPPPTTTMRGPGNSKAGTSAELVATTPSPKGSQSSSKTLWKRMFHR